MCNCNCDSKLTPHDVTEDASLLVTTLLEADPETFDPEAEITRLSTYTCPECGSTNTSQPDNEGLVDCMKCGIWFQPNHPRNRHALHGQPEGSLCQGCGKPITINTRNLVADPFRPGPGRDTRWLCGQCAAQANNSRRFWNSKGRPHLREDEAPDPANPDPQTPEQFQDYIDKYAGGPERKSISHIETTSDYREYEMRVRDFFRDEGITNLSTKADEEGNTEASFSWRRCDCCHRSLGGDRYECSGWNPTAQQIQEYSVCQDCVYYAEYGKLDDTTMMNLKDDLKPEPPAK